MQNEQPYEQDIHYTLADMRALLFLPPPINQNYPKYSKTLEDIDKQIKGITDTYTVFGEHRKLQQINPAVSKSTLLTQQVKEQLKDLNQKIFKKMLKCVQIFTGKSAQTNPNYYSQRLVEQTKNFLTRCRQIKSMQVRQSICKIIQEETIELINETTKMKQALLEVKQSFGCYEDNIEENYLRQNDHPITIKDNQMMDENNGKTNKDKQNENEYLQRFSLNEIDHEENQSAISDIF